MWSKLKKSMEERIAPSLDGRVGLHATRYREGYAYEGRWWITVDGRRVFGGYTRRGGGEYWEVSTEIGDAASGGGAPDAPPLHAVEREDLRGRNAAEHFTTTLAGYLDLSIDAALGSDDPLVRALAMIDRRVGKRRLKSMLLGEGEHPLVRAMLELRREAERVTPDAPDQG